MARPLRLFSLLPRTGALLATPTHCRGFVSRGAGGRAWTAESHGPRASVRAPRYHDEEWGEAATEEVEDKLQDLMNEERKRRKNIKYNILRRKMTQPGAPERRLTWEAIEQIRYLKQEQPEEWTVERLAEGFSVRPEVILRVLRSKFIPAADRKAKQDAKAVAALGQQMLPTGAGARQAWQRLPGNQSVAAITPGNGGGTLVPLAEGTQMAVVTNSVSLVKHSAPAELVPSLFNAGIRKDAAVIPNSAEDRITTTDTTEDSEDDDDWDGWVFSEEELEELIEMKKPSPPVQVGNNFFDSEGNLLYRI